MGYRSDVAFVIRRNEKADTTIRDLLTLAKMADIDPQEAWKGYDFRMNWDDDMFVFNIEHVKWYEGFPEVMCMDNLMKFALETKKFSYVFARTGEETDDNEYVAEGENPPYECVSIIRSVCLDVDLKGE